MVVKCHYTQEANRTGILGFPRFSGLVELE